MGIYAVTGGSSGIGAKTVEFLRAQGHLVYNIDLNGGDINANLASEEGRNQTIERLHQLCEHGMDGLVCCAGVNNSCGNLGLIISLNYFGAIRLAEGVYDLLEMRRGACVVVCSNTISQIQVRMDIVNLLNNDANEARAQKLLSTLDPKRDGHATYVASKYALARWMRRVSADWAAHGVRINAIAPGNVETAMTARMTEAEHHATMALPIPTLYGQDRLMDPADIAGSITFLVSQQAHGLNGIVLFCDGGTDALLNSEKVY